jgi:SsrA-binding protein
MKIFAQNRKAHHNYAILETFEAGIVLHGNEVKSIRLNNISLMGAYAIISEGNLVLINCHINDYAFSYDKKTKNELRNRILLAHKKEINKLAITIKTKRVTLIPLKVYENSKGYIKIQIGIAKHKNLVDRKEEIKNRDLDRSARREMSEKE